MVAETKSLIASLFSQALRLWLALLALLGVCLVLPSPAGAADTGWREPRAGQSLRERVADRRDVAGERDWRVLRDLAYGPAGRQRLDVYLPRERVATQTLFLVHGGGWRHGDKRSADFIRAKVAHWLPRGVAVVAVNYRLLPDTPVADQAADVARALAFAQQQAPHWQLDAGRFVLMGHSAGAHLVSLLATDTGLAAAAGVQPWLGTVSLDSAAVDVPQLMQRRHLPLYDEAFGADPAQWRALSPRHQLRERPAPLLLVCSSTRPDKPCTPNGEFAAAVQALGGRAELLAIAKSHGEINTELGTDPAYTAKVDAFLASLIPPTPASAG